MENIIDTRINKNEHMKISNRSRFSQLISCNKTNGIEMAFYYIMVKILCVVNIIGQFFMLAYFLGVRHEMFGWNLFVDLVSGRQWHNSGVFPRVTMCDFEVNIMKSKLQNRVELCTVLIFR